MHLVILISPILHTAFTDCALLFCLEKPTRLAQNAHLHRGNVHSGLNAYTVIMKTDMGKKLARLMVTILLASHYAPDASHMHPISSGVSILSLALKLLGSNKYRILAFLENNAFKARITFVHMRKKELLAKKAQKLFHSTCVFCDTISLLFSLRLFSLGIGKSIP